MAKKSTMKSSTSKPNGTGGRETANAQESTMQPAATVASERERAAAEPTPLTNGVKVLTESLILPGSSLIMDGDIKNGTLHALAGLVSRALLGPLGWFAFAANSYSNSVTGKHVYQHFFESKSASKESSTSAEAVSQA